MKERDDAKNRAEIAEAEADILSHYIAMEYVDALKAEARAARLTAILEGESATDLMGELETIYDTIYRHGLREAGNLQMRELLYRLFGPETVDDFALWRKP